MPLLTAHELAKELKVTVDTVWRYTRRGKIPSIRLGPREYRYRLEDVLAALVSPEKGAKAEGTGVLKASEPGLLYAFAGEIPGKAEDGDGR
ncbi:MAG: helix-turn-helix domain-containing protein [Firmicutes bacterium]|nr:helix-turn-helix domain-containing protein [Bacillota bacterium]